MKINLDKIAGKVEVDNRYPLRFYYRIADNLLRQASIHREENNVIDLYIILLRFSSLVTETIPFHRDYQNFQREKTLYKKKLLTVIEELEYLKPEFNRRVEELNKDYDRSQQLDGPEATSYGSEQSSVQWPYANQSSYTSIDNKQSSIMVAKPSWQYDNNHSRVSSSNSSQIDRQFQKLGISLPLPKQETLSRHSFLGPNGLRGQWQGPTPEIKVQYPSTTDISSAEKPTLNQDGQSGIMTVKDSNSVGVGSAMESVLSLDDGRWIHSSEEPCKALVNEMREDPFQFVSIRQPSPPPVLAQVHQQPIPPHRVADPRPGPANSSQDEMPTSNSYQHLHVAVNMMEEFLRLASANTQKNLETCGVLAGSLRNKVFHITTLIIPKQESTSDSCQTLNEEEIFEVQDRLSLFPLGWIHTHPTQTCFMSSVDLHTHYSYQIMLPEAIAIVMAPTDSSSPHGIFHLSDPGGVNIIRNCEQRGFHPHEEPLDGSPIYEHCSHVYMNSKLKYDIVDLR